MTKRSFLIGVIALVLTGGPQLPAVNAAEKPSPAVDITARADQSFAPATIVMHVGKPEVLRFTSAGGVHGIASTQLGIPATMIIPNQPVSVTVTPAKAGTYVLPCTIVCGANHSTMHLTVNVKA